MIEPCPIHDDAAYDSYGNIISACKTCTRLRASLADRRRRNAKAGRHPRETLVRVPNEPLRRVFLELQALGRAEARRVASAAGMTKVDRRTKQRVGDSDWLKVRLGLKDTSGKDIDPQTGRRRIVRSEVVEYETAVRICQAMGVDPVEVGI